LFSPIKNTKVYEQVIEQIKQMIIDGTLKTGDKLPTERVLSEELQVSRTSIREALRALQIIGLVDCRQGEGNFINKEFENSLFEPLSMMFMLQESSSIEILELRRVIEAETAKMAAKKITDEELKSLGMLLKSFDNINNEEDNSEIDKKFHYEIAKASGNFLIFSILNAISSLMDAFIKDARKKILSEEDNIEVLAKQHWYIYEALQNHDPEKASEAMVKHLDFTNKYYM
jgi:GntR family transcriptional regulator, transcriptional repressor for pyruvate dehydrogenase complex